MTLINGIWHDFRPGILRASMLDGWMTVSQRGEYFAWRIVSCNQVTRGVADTRDEAMAQAERAYAHLHTGKP